jgi:predicted CXXCH cytochrome family protein
MFKENDVMKKLLIAMVLGLLLLAALATVASADNGPHGSFAPSTDACASCHRAHSAQYGSNALLKDADVEALCLSCHNGAGAGTNVVDGVYTTANVTGGEGVNGGSLFGGGFTNALMATNWSGKLTADTAYDATSKATTSHHNLGAGQTVWGSGLNNSVNGTMALECTSCHTPHGTGGFANADKLTPTVAIGNKCDPTIVATSPCTAPVRSYRLLRWQPSGSNGFTAPATSVNWSGGAFPSKDGTATGTGWTVPDDYAILGTEWYTIGTETMVASTRAGSAPVGPFAVGDYNNGNTQNTYRPLNASAVTQSYVPAAVNMAFFCAQCHDRYFNNTALRDNTDPSAYCGTLVTAPATTGGVHPNDPIRCLPVYNTAGTTLTGWGDNGASGDNTYMFRHNSGDIRVSIDGAIAAGSGTTVSRSCVACHVAHGTTSAMTALASNNTQVPNNPLLTGINNSVLLRMDNRSLCLRCHGSSIGFVVGP